MTTTQPAGVASPNPILQFFAYEHLPERLQRWSKPIGDLAREMAAQLPSSAETSAGLRKLLEAKDCFVRAALSLPPFASMTEGDLQRGYAQAVRP